MPKVAIVMGSKTDESYMDLTEDVLKAMGIEFETHIMSAHRNPEKIPRVGEVGPGSRIEVIIAGAGGAAHLPGVIASWTTLPVIGVPLPTTDLHGADALHAIVQMPAGVPVATVAVGKSGAKNSAYLSAEILGLKYENIRKAYDDYRAAQAG